jgi:hypothetical protein
MWSARLILMLVTSCACASEWSGTIKIYEQLQGHEVKDKDERAELEEIYQELEDRLEATNKQLKKAGPAEAGVLREDAGYLEAEMERTALERGGNVRLGRATYVIDGDRLVFNGEEARVLIDRKKGIATVIAGERKDTVKLKTPIEPRSSDDDEAGPALKAFEDLETRHTRIKAEDQEYDVVYAPSLPNVYALGMLPSTPKDSLQGTLARVPGLPMRVEGVGKGISHQWLVHSVQPGVVDKRQFRDFADETQNEK